MCRNPTGTKRSVPLCWNWLGRPLSIVRFQLDRGRARCGEKFSGSKLVQLGARLDGQAHCYNCFSNHRRCLDCLVGQNSYNLHRRLTGFSRVMHDMPATFIDVRRRGPVSSALIPKHTRNSDRLTVCKVSTFRIRHGLWRKAKFFQLETRLDKAHGEPQNPVVLAPCRVLKLGETAFGGRDRRHFGSRRIASRDPD